MEITAFKENLDLTWDLIRKSSEGQSQVLQSNDPEQIKKAIDSQFPYGPVEYADLLKELQDQVLPFLNQNRSTQYGAYITGSGNPISVLGEFVKAFYNQNGLKWNNSPITSELEQLVIRWIADFIGLPEFGQGVLTSGGSMSNFLAIHFALTDKYPNRENEGLPHNKVTVYCSDQTHSSVDRAMVFLGLGRNQLRKISTNEFRLDAEQVKKAVNDDLEKGFEPLMIIGNAGTTNTGSIDPLEELGNVAKSLGLWYHVDGAYGIPARRLPDLEKEFAGVELADSIIINPHKWLYVTFEASCVLLREIPKSFHFTPDYLFTESPGLRWESSEHTIELSKEFRALKIWMTLKYYGADQLASFIQNDIAMISYFADELQKVPNVEVEPEHPLSILCFRYSNPALSPEANELINIQTLRNIESEGKVFLTGTRLRGKTYLRAYFGNPDRSKSDVDQMVEVVRATVSSVATS